MVKEIVDKRYAVFGCLATLVLIGTVTWLALLPVQAATSLQAYWKFDEGTAGATAVDSSGNGNSLTPVNDPTPSTDIPGVMNGSITDTHSASFNGTTQYYSASDSSMPDYTSAMSISVWVKFNTVNSTYQTIVSKWNVGVAQQFSLQLNSDNHIGWWTGDGGGVAAQDGLESTSTLSAGVWYHITATAAGTAKQLYINGALDNSKTDAATAMGTASGVNLGIGGKASGSTVEYLNGNIDDARLYGRVLSGSEANMLASGSESNILTGSGALANEIGTTSTFTDLQVTSDTGVNPTVYVKLYVNNGTLSLSTTTGLTFYDANGSSLGNSQPANTADLHIGGSLSDINAALATLMYRRTSGTGTDSLSASLVRPGEVFFPGNDHLYEYVPGPVTWSQAKTAAAASSKYGAQGYLATITSQAENDFILNRLKSDSWIGASDAADEGAWKWVTGPEAGQQFWQGTGSGSIVNGMYAHWNNPVTGGTGVEPNQAGDEDCGEFYYSNNGLWNDLSCGNSLGYIIEYGAPGNLPTVSSKSVAITTADTIAPTVSAGSNHQTNTSFSQTSATASDSGSGIASYAWSKQSGPGTVTFSNNGVLKPTISAVSQDGTYDLRLTVTDNAGNTAHDDFTLIWDTTNPDITLDSFPDLFTRQSSASFSFHGSDSLSPPVNYTCKLDGFSFNVCTSPQAYSGLAEGLHTVTIRATDQSGNSSETSAYSWTVDSTPPIITRTGSASVDVVQGQPYHDAGATATDNANGNITASIATSNPVNTATVGTYTITYNVSDQAGNAATAVTRTVRVLSNADMDGDGIADSVQQNVANTTNDDSHDVAVKVDNSCSLSNVSVKNQSQLGGDEDFSYPLGLLDFVADCGTNGFTTTVTQYYYNPPVGDFVLRKFVNGSYQTVHGANFSHQTLNGIDVLVVSYQVADGGPLDADGAENGVIVDPAGPALAIHPVSSGSILAPSTGFAMQSLTFIYAHALVMISLGLLLSGALLSFRRSRNTVRPAGSANNTHETP